MNPIVTLQAEPVRPTLKTPRDVSWQAALRSAVRDPAELCRLVGLPKDFAEAAIRAASDFPLFAPRGYIARIQPGNPTDPLLRQVLPVAGELASEPGDRSDPVGDLASELRPGLLHKYHGRVLLVTTGACAVHCRYCFRRHFPYAAVPHAPSQWRPAIAAIAADPSLGEVILSGGDPLTLVDAHLAELTSELSQISHLKRLRIHTRLPIMIPERVTNELLAWLTATRLTPVVVIHANHAAELDGTVADAVARLVEARVLVLNQAVLLAGVNDTLEAQLELCERLVALRVVPYYLHQLDRVAGATHFEVPIAKGRRLVESLRAQLPGYAVPRFVQEVVGAASKIVLA